MKKVKAFLLSLGVAGVMSAAILAVAAAVIAKSGNLPQGPALTVLVTATVCIGVFLGGLSAALFSGEKGALLGGACGLLAACVVAAGSLVVYQGALTISGGARLAAIFLSGCIGGILGVNRKQKVKF